MPLQKPIRIAQRDDIPMLIKHHRLMFEEIWHLNNLKTDKKKLKAMDIAYQKKLERELNSGACKAWIIKDNRIPIASGAISIASGVPNPDDDSCRMAYLHSIYTEAEYRKTGLAQKVVEQIIDYCKLEGITRLNLNSSEAGKSIYQKLGFQASETVMRLSLLQQK